MDAIATLTTNPTVDLPMEVSRVVAGWARERDVRVVLSLGGGKVEGDAA